MTKRSKLNNISIWDDPNAKFKSQYGITTHAEWCEKDASRMRQNGGTAKAVKCEGLCAIIKQ